MSSLVAGPQTLLNAESADETLGVPLITRGESNNVTVVIQGNGTTSTGVVTIEESYYVPVDGPAFSGTWSAVTTVNASAVSGGGQQIVHVIGNPWAVRTRISTVIGGGGTITSIAWAN